jgi:hypothetical protein
MTFSKNHYLKSLEDRVAKLESYLTKEGVKEVGLEHWQYLPTSNGLMMEFLSLGL